MGCDLMPPDSWCCGSCGGQLRPASTEAVRTSQKQGSETPPEQVAEPAEVPQLPGRAPRDWPRSYARTRQLAPGQAAHEADQGPAAPKQQRQGGPSADPRLTRLTELSAPPWLRFGAAGGPGRPQSGLRIHLRRPTSACAPRSCGQVSQARLPGRAGTPGVLRHPAHSPAGHLCPSSPPLEPRAQARV